VFLSGKAIFGLSKARAETKMFEEEDVNSAKLNLLAAVFAVALFGTAAVAQEGPRGPRGGFGGAAPELRGLDLSDAQKAQVKQIMAAESPL